MNVLTVLVICLPLAAALVALLTPSGSAAAPRAGYLLNAAGLGLALVLLVSSLSSGATGLVFAPGGEAWLGVAADRLGSLLLVLICGVSTVVQAFAGRYLHGDIRQRRFFVAANLLAAATAFMVLSVTLVGLAAGWTLAGLSLLMLLGMYPGVAAADTGTRRTAIAFLAGDAALWVAVIVATATWGSIDLRQIDASGLTDSGGLALTCVALLAVIAALSRSGQLPFQTWLPMTVAVPTPVSALLHAGVVNAGGILLVRMSPVFGASAEATHIAFFAGAATMVYGTSIMLAKSDVKGALAHSTMGQMGFMIMTCGLGAWAAAIFHLVAHGMYKASLFLGSGSAVQNAAGGRKAPPAPAAGPSDRRMVAAVSVIVPGIAVLAGAALIYPDPSSPSVALLAFAWATAAWSLWGWSARQHGAGGVAAGCAAMAAAVFGYVFLIRIAGDFLGPDLADAGTATVAAGWILLPLAAIAAIAALRSRAGSGLLSDLHKHLYVGLLAASQSGFTMPRGFTLGRLGDARAGGGLMPSSEGVRT